MVMAVVEIPHDIFLWADHCVTTMCICWPKVYLRGDVHACKNCKANVKWEKNAKWRKITSERKVKDCRVLMLIG